MLSLAVVALGGGEVRCQREKKKVTARYSCGCQHSQAETTDQRKFKVSLVHIASSETVRVSF